MTKSTRLSRAVLAVGAIALIGVAATPGLASAAAKTVLVSQSSGEQKGNGDSGEPSVSGTGRFIAFSSDAENLVGDDNNGRLDCFVRDRVNGSTARVSVQSDGGQSNGRCFGPAISQNGRWVAFDSNATDLGSSNGRIQIYVHDRNTGDTRLVSESTAGGQGGNGLSEDPAISADGRFVAFESTATNLVGNDTNGVKDVFVWDQQDGSIQRVSVRSTGLQGNDASLDPAISADGNLIVFSSNATNLIAKDTNGKRDIFIHARQSGKTSRVSINSRERQANGTSGNAAINGNGRFVAFESRANNLVGADRTRGLDVFLRDRKLGKTVQVSVSSKGRQGGGWSGDPTISGSGRWIAFESSGPYLVGNDTNGERDAFVRDRVKRTTKIVSRRANGKPARGESDDAYVSSDGRFIAFESRARFIVPKDTDPLEDIFLRGPLR